MISEDGKYERGKATSPEQERIWDALANIMNIRDADENLDLERSIPEVQNAVEKYLAQAADSADLEARKEWAADEFVRLGQTFRFTPADAARLQKLFRELFLEESPDQQSD